MNHSPLRSGRALPALLVGMVACAPVLPDPVLHEIAPSWGYNGEDTDVLITGSGFYPRVQVAGTETFEIDRQYRAWLLGGEDAELSGVSLVDYDTLEARVPAGLTPGRYDLQVQAPTGRRVALDQAFTVTDNRADHLVTETDGTRFPARLPVTVGIQVQDPEGNAVAMPLEIVVSVDQGPDESGVVFDDTLDEQENLAGEVGVRGFLGQSGGGWVTLTSTFPDEFLLTVAPAEPDSVISPATEYLVFTAGDAAAVRIDLPSDDFVSEAGDLFDLNLTLLDANGFPTEGVVGSVTLTEQCNGSPTGLRELVSFVDTTTVSDVAVTGATGSDCPENSILAYGAARGSLVEGQSDPFQVQPGVADHFDVDVRPSQIVAGADTAVVTIDALDAWGNAITDHEDVINVIDSVGGLDPEAGIGQAWCTDMLEGKASCLVHLWVAAEDVTLTVTGDSGTEGVSNAFDVVHGEPDQVEVEVDDTTVVAGERFDLTVRAVDDFGNPIALDVAGSDAPVFDDGAGSVRCEWSISVDPPGTERYACVTTWAQDAKTVEALVATLAIAGHSNPFDVVNADLASVVLDTAGTSTVVAGGTLGIQVSAFDEFGNPYRVQAVTSIDLYDDAGDVDAVPVPLDVSGTGSASPTLTTAWTDNRVYGVVSGATLGSTPVFDVVAGSLADFSVELPRTFAWIDEPLDVTITAVDIFGNAVTSFSSTVTVSSRDALGSNVSVNAFTGGAAVATFTFNTRGPQDVLRAHSGGITGTSAPVDAVSGDCATGPEAALEVKGASTATVCLTTSGVTAAIHLDASGSAAGSAALTAWHFDAGDGDWSRLVADSTTHQWAAAGGYLAQVVTVDAAACADLATAEVFVADYDLEPTGPVTLTVSPSTLRATSTTSGTATVELYAEDCAGDPSLGGTVYLWADLGEVTSGTSAVTPTGAGLAVTLGSSSSEAGTASVEWTMATEEHGGTATLHAGVLSGAAYGSQTVTVTGESDHPMVKWVDPAGTTDELFNSVAVQFSEPLRSSSVTQSEVVLFDPDMATVGVTAFTFSDSNATVVIELQDEQDAAAGTYTLAMSSKVRDSGGTPLDGGYTGGASAFLLQFGDVVDGSVDITACTPSSTVIRPDGDDGSGSEADGVELAVSATATPAWWELVITDSDGEEILVSREGSSAASAKLTWDGRRQDGSVVPNGTYDLVVAGLDTYWNAGSGCTVQAVVDNLIRAPVATP